MADELNIPTHRWYEPRNHIALAKEDYSRQYIYDSGIQKIDAWINSQPWGEPPVSYAVLGFEPDLVLDFVSEFYSYDDTRYEAGGRYPDLVLDFAREFYEDTRYEADRIYPDLILDFKDEFYTDAGEPPPPPNRAFPYTFPITLA